jgi:hypothetical protein
MSTRFFGVVTDFLDLKQIADGQLLQWSTATSSRLSAREANPTKSKQIMDVHFDDLSRDPMKVVRLVYQQIGLTLEKEAEDRMHAYLQGKVGDGLGKKGSHCAHSYEHEWFGWTKSQALGDDSFHAYCNSIKSAH